MKISVPFIRIQKVKRLSLGKKYKVLVLSGPKTESVSINALESTVLIIQKPEIEWTPLSEPRNFEEVVSVKHSFID